MGRRRTRSSTSAMSDEPDALNSSGCSSKSETKSKRTNRKGKSGLDDISEKVKSGNISDVNVVLHRTQELADITTLFMIYSPCIYITGPSGSGKSYCVDHVIKKIRTNSVCKIASVNMKDTLKVQGFYYSVLSQLLETSLIPTVVDHTCDFVRLLNETTTDKAIVVIKSAHLLMDLNSLLFLAISKLNELTQQKISVVMLSDAPWDTLYSINGSTLTKPLIVNIPPYNRAEMIDIITRYLITKFANICTELCITETAAKSYVRTCIYDTLAHYTSSLREMIKLSTNMFERYVEPIRKSELAKTDSIKLYQRLLPSIMKATKELSCVTSLKPSMELPYNCRVLLIGAFLASHNPARLDKRFFCKARSSRRKVKTRTTAKLSEVLKGPKTFGFDRLIAIYASITQDGTIPCSDIMMAISSLVSLNLIVRMSVDMLEQPKYKCLVPLESIQSLARESGIDFEQYYYNY